MPSSRLPLYGSSSAGGSPNGTPRSAGRGDSSIYCLGGRLWVSDVNTLFKAKFDTNAREYSDEKASVNLESLAAGLPHGLTNLEQHLQPRSSKAISLM